MATRPRQWPSIRPITSLFGWANTHHSKIRVILVKMWNFEKSMDGGRPSTRKFGKNSKEAPVNEGKGWAKGPSIRPITKKITEKRQKHSTRLRIRNTDEPREVGKLFLWNKIYGLVLVLNLSLHEFRRFLKRKRDSHIFYFGHQGVFTL